VSVSNNFSLDVSTSCGTCDSMNRMSGEELELTLKEIPKVPAPIS
jgi:hypothetical protein